MEAVNPIQVDQLRLLPFCQLIHLEKYLPSINPQFLIEDAYNLYLYLLKHKSTLTSQQLIQMLSIKQPKETIELVYSQELVKYHLQNIHLPNSFTVFRLVNHKITDQTLRRVIQLYFWCRSQQEGINRSINKQILGLLKFWTQNKTISSEQIFKVFEEVYSTGKELNIENQFLLIELILSLRNNRDLGYLATSERFKQDVINGLLAFNSGYCNILTPNIYMELARVHKDQCKEVEVFLDIFSTLNSFGVHLIKDVWEQFEILCNSRRQLNYLSMDTLMCVLLRKVAKHNNQNIPKHCIRQLLKSQSVNMLDLFTEHQSVVYQQLIPTLNSGQFYLDCPLQKDSKFFTYVWRFFSRAYNQMSPQTLQSHLKLFIQSVSNHITYDQALPAFLMVFKYIQNSVPFFGSDEVDIVVAFLQKVYKNVHMRKRWQMVSGILECLGRFLSPDVTFKELIRVVLVIPDEAYRWKFIHDDGELQSKKYSHTFNLKQKLKKILQQIPEQQLKTQISKLSQFLHNPAAVQDLYRLLKIHLWVPIPEIGHLISEFSKSSYATQEELDVVVLSLYWQAQSLEVIQWKVDEVLNIIKFYILEHYHSQYQTQIVQVVGKLTRQVLESSNQNFRQQMAKFVEWLVYSISQPEPTEHLYIQYQLLLQIVRLEHSVKQIQLQIQECLYGLSGKINALPTPKQNRYPAIKLRLEVNLSLLLSRDPTFKDQQRRQFIEDPLSLIDRYDYEHYPQAIRFLRIQYLPYALQKERYQELHRLQEALLESLLCNLEYSIVKEDVASYVQFILDDRVLGSKALWEQKYLDKWLLSILKTGANYIYFHRILSNTLYRYLTSNYQLIKQQLLLYYVDVVYELLQLEEYRGFDSEVAFYEEQKILNVIELRRNLPQKAEYFGMYPRLLFMKFIEGQIKEQYHPVEEQFLLKLGWKIFKFSIEDQSANRMIFSPAFRSKLRLWQLMQVLVPFYNNPQISNHVPELGNLFLKQFEQPNQPQIKHYIQLFMTRVILHYPQHFTPLMVDRLKTESRLSQSITNVIVSGLLLKKRFDLELYNSLLSLICHNTAYLRGLTQYFCFYRFSAFQSLIEKDSLVRRLYEQFVTNADSVRLAERVHTLITHYEFQIQKCDVEYFCKLEVYKAGEIVEEYIQDGLKRVGLEIVRQIKDNDEGFVLMKDLWKAEAQQVLPKETSIVEETKGFQKKIDPAIQEIYAIEKMPSVTNLRILASNLNSIYTYGHLVRTGEIFSIEELAIRSSSILSDDGFKTVSCTGEKWLNTREVPLDAALSYILECIELGYTPVLIKEQNTAQPLIQYQINQKTLLILPNQEKQFQQFIGGLPIQKLFVGTGLSVHVEAAIFMWQYIKQRILPKSK